MPRETVASVDRIHHERTWRYVCLYLYVFVLRLLARVEVALTDKLRPPVGPDVKVTKVHIPSRDPGRSIVAFIYEPVNKPEGPLPVNMNIHGSGFMVPAFFGNSRYFNSLMASKLQCYVIDTDYRKAPEYPFPYPLYDCRDTMSWIFANKEGRFDLDRVSVTGFSAGGNLALSTANTMGPERIKSVVTFYPPTDATSSGAPVGDRSNPPSEFRSGVLLEPWAFRVMYSSYVPMQLDPAIPELCVINLPLERYPAHMMFIAGKADVLYPDSKAFYDHIAKNGSSAQKQHARLLSVPNEAHAFDEQPKHPESVKWRDTVYLEAIRMIEQAWYPEREPTVSPYGA
ncbi:hypothetical protein MNAN1_002345 [Malassezia nana]|uniref:Alpha/beta hydrolase fold-3 domain-containing protein n=1 Tax=Malassezia nana TaxID=180528 RepID=A0AAF0EKC8_9BASI|nr:hypothetical protein MNAN1_002345 [Malassezia nana]